MNSEPLPNRRRTVFAGAVALVASALPWAARAQAGTAEPERRWYEAAAQMMRLAQTWGDQPYGAVLVMDGMLVGEGPSRVVKSRDPDAHAEREAIRDAQRKLGLEVLAGAVLYSTSRPCRLCEAAAERAGVGRMYFGPSLSDGGSPGSHGDDQDLARPDARTLARTMSAPELLAFIEGLAPRVVGYPWIRGRFWPTMPTNMGRHGPVTPVQRPDAGDRS